MKAIIYIAVLLISASAFAQTALDSIILKKANEYRDSLCLPKLEFSKTCFSAAESQAAFQMKDLSRITHDQNGSDIGDRYKKASRRKNTYDRTDTADPTKHIEDKDRYHESC